MTLNAAAVRPFVPAKDFAASKAFYIALGFEKILDSDVAIFSCAGGGSFILQNFYVKEWAGNFMMQLMVPDLDEWWSHIEALDLGTKFNTTLMKPPEVQPWGLRVAYISDPSGVLRHIAETRLGARQDFN